MLRNPVSYPCSDKIVGMKTVGKKQADLAIAVDVNDIKIAIFFRPKIKIDGVTKPVVGTVSPESNIEVLLFFYLLDLLE